MVAASGRRPDGKRSKWLFLSFLVYLLARTLTLVFWPDDLSAQVFPTFLVLFPVLYAAFVYFELGGVMTAAAIVVANILIRTALRIESNLPNQILVSTWLAAAGIGLLVGHVARINHQLRSRTQALQLVFQ